MNSVLEISGLSKSYGKTQALNNLSLSIESGSIYGILGPNGSGKTTTLGIIMDVIHEDAGSYSWFNGVPSNEARKKIGAFIESPNFYPYLSALQNLKLAATIKGRGHKRIKDVLELVGLHKRRNSKFSTFSFGMKQRLALAAALLGKPDVLVLDEPTNGLDPQGIAEIRDLIVNIGQQGKTIILASHLLDEVEKVCTHVGIIKNGNLLASGKVSEVLADEERIEIAASDLAKLETIANGHPKMKSIRKEKEYLVMTFSEKVRPEEVNQFFYTHNITLSKLTLRKKSLETQFLEITGNG